MVTFHNAIAGSISERLREKHFSSLRSGKHQQNCWHFPALSREAFLSACAGSISHHWIVGSINSIVGISQRFRRKHFTSSRWTGSISICWHFAALSPEAFHIVIVDGKHFAASERINDGKHQPIAGRLDHSPMGGILQRQSESMTGSISTTPWGRRHFAALSPEAFHIVKVDGKHQHMLAFHSAFAGSISHRHCGREASAYAGKDIFEVM